MRPLPIQLNGVASEPEVYRYVIQSYLGFGQAVASKVMQNAAELGTLDDAEQAGGCTGGPPDPQDLADAMVSVWGKLNFGPLEEMVNR